MSTFIPASRGAFSFASSTDISVTNDTDNLMNLVPKMEVSKIDTKIVHSKTEDRTNLFQLVTEPASFLLSVRKSSWKSVSDVLLTDDLYDSTAVMSFRKKKHSNAVSSSFKTYLPKHLLVTVYKILLTLEKPALARENGFCDICIGQSAKVRWRDAREDILGYFAFITKRETDSLSTFGTLSMPL